MLVGERKRVLLAAGSGGIQQPDRILAGGVRLLRFDVALPVERTAVFGASASAALPRATGRRLSTPALMPATVPRPYHVAGKQEPFFLETAVRWANALRDAGADVVMTERVGSTATHSGKRSFH